MNYAEGFETVDFDMTNVSDIKHTACIKIHAHIIYTNHDISVELQCLFEAAAQVKI